jgi:hypothetical protein
VKQRSGDLLYLKFNDAGESQAFSETVVTLQQDRQGEINVLKKQEILSDLIHKDQKEVGFSMTLYAGKAEVHIWPTTEKAIEDQMNHIYKEQWLMT